MFKYLKIGYFITLFGLLIYSFTQVDLNLTLSQISIFQTAQKSLQQIGFFNRPLSTTIYVLLAVLMFLFYFSFLFMAWKKKIVAKHAWVLIIGAIVILTFSYNAFSYDLFNYMFDAKILSLYGQNPFLHRPLDFTGDPWLNFMRWTHRIYPYGPSWLILTVPLSFIGMNYFLPTFFLFKVLMALSFFGTTYLIYKISEKLSPQNVVFNLVFWGLNPLVLIEGLVSAHNDMPMAFFGLLFIYLFINKKITGSLLSYLFSIGVKYATAVLFPVIILLFYLKQANKKINWDKIFLYFVVLSAGAVVIATVRSTFQPWYLLYILPFAALIAKKLYVFIPTVAATIFGIAIYVPYVLLTDYSKSYPAVVMQIELIGFLTVVILLIIFSLKAHFKKAS
ncbi:MAG: hypothetical protein A2W22_00305 [Candidatus Levybacteria bacterium RBG_16_35_11]|nr:MAG: hypothetical protein A2W22_00305 [Candidatus Levybacteria bacterium RBG_16_35_11]